MKRVVRIVTKGPGPNRVGIPVTEGPGTFRLLLTWPYRDEGRIAEIPLEDIDHVEDVYQECVGEKPRALDEQVPEPA